ncbi:hypothetical protein Clacol_006680 [Clathrus columnatus]|uniref:J domain-containing protein n=1 Tax=Clathrus columnatus TaxID=1419009 RepID=A0AAV5AG12_9AGAM|nr:hypothetical protein Clacol_006680 [Clathrus columnatus]
MEDSDPLAQFFPDNVDVNLYEVLSLERDATINDIKSAYRKLALTCHPDKHNASWSEEEKTRASMRFQQIGFAYAVLGDEKKRKKYDKTGSVSDSSWEGRDEEGWEMYFAEMFEKVTRGRLDEMKKAYQGSEEEINDLKEAYEKTSGCIESIMNEIPHSTYNDEPRFVEIIKGLIADGRLESLPNWSKALKDKKGRETRRRKGEKEAQEAEEMAKDLGVWDEFYGTGKEGKRQGIGKKKQGKEKEEEDGEAVLKALIQKRQKKLDGFLDSLADKYGAMEGDSKKGKKRKAEDTKTADRKAKKKKN